MKKQMTEKINKKTVGAGPVSAQSSKARQNSGITLIALVITIIVMLILVAVTISMAVKGGLFDYAGKATVDTKNAIEAEGQMANGGVEVDGVWYDSIDDYLKKKPSSNQGEGEEGPVKISLRITGTKVEEVPLPSSDFEHVEGTIETGYVIRHKTDGNEFVWVPVDKNQKITLEVKSEKEIEELKLYDPYGDEILTLGNNQIEKTYSNTDIEPTVNGRYTAVLMMEDGTTEKELLTVRSLYAKDIWNDWYTSDEYVKMQGFDTKQEMYQTWADDQGYASIEEMLQALGYSSIEQYEMDFSWQKGYEDLVDRTESVNTNGGFYIARYEAGTSIEVYAADKNATVDDIKTERGVPVSQKGYIPYTYITYAQAKGLAECMYERNDSYEVGLLTGSAWDRTLGWIFETGNKSMYEIVNDSTNWGNYKYAEFEYTHTSGETYTKHADRGEMLLSTGATTRNSANNIFDFAGNAGEWTDESDEYGGIAIRGRYVQGSKDKYCVWLHP